MLEADEEAFASELVSEAFVGFEQVFTPDVAALLRAMLESELVATATGKRMLRACQADPVVDRSGDLAKGGANARRPPKASGDE